MGNVESKLACRSAGEEARTYYAPRTPGFKNKDRLMVPARVAIALQEDGCAGCGSPWRRVTKPSERYQQFLDDGRSFHDHSADEERGMHAKRGDNTSTEFFDAGIVSAEYETIGWEPTCACGDARPPVPCVVLDPFGGAGTTAMVADRLQRDAVLCELNPDYAEMAKKRLDADSPPLLSRNVLEAAE